MSHTSKETIAAYQFKRSLRRQDARDAAEESAPRARSRVAPAIVLAAELVLLAFGFAIGATIRQVSADGPPGCCAVSK